MLRTNLPSYIRNTNRTDVWIPRYTSNLKSSPIIAATLSAQPNESTMSSARLGRDDGNAGFLTDSEEEPTTFVVDLMGLGTVRVCNVLRSIEDNPGFLVIVGTESEEPARRSALVVVVDLIGWDTVRAWIMGGFADFVDVFALVVATGRLTVAVVFAEATGFFKASSNGSSSSVSARTVGSVFSF